MNIRQISDAIWFVILIIDIVVRLIATFFITTVDTIKYEVFGIEISTGPDMYISGRSSVGTTDGENRCNILISSDKDVFDINDVTVEVGYGTFYIDEKEKYENEAYSDVYFALYVCNEEYSYRVTQTRDNYQYIPPDTYLLLDVPKGEGYNTDYAYDYDGDFLRYDVEYKCKKTLTIPKEVFSGSEGTVTFTFAGFLYYPENPYQKEPKPYYSCVNNTYSIDLDYKLIDGNTVDLQFDNEKTQSIY